MQPIRGSWTLAGAAILGPWLARVKTPVQLGGGTWSAVEARCVVGARGTSAPEDARNGHVTDA